MFSAASKLSIVKFKVAVNGTITVQYTYDHDVVITDHCVALVNLLE